MRGTPAASSLSVAEIAMAVQQKPELRNKIATVHGDSALDRNSKMTEIARLVREEAEVVVARPPSALETAQAAWRPTMEQSAANRAAALEQNALAKAAEAKRIAQPVGRVWSSFGGETIASTMLQHVDLVDARYLLALHAHGGVIPRWQDLPPSAKIDRACVWRLYAWERMFSLGILVLSYPWLDGDHPDKAGEHLGRLAPILQHMLAFCGGAEFSCGVLWDYCSLPQPPRTAAQEQRFAAGLSSLMTWYAHPYTHVLLMAGELPVGAAYTNTRAYTERGWCEAERATAGLTKCTHCMWDMRGFDPVALGALEGMALFDGLRSQLKSGRPAPATPPAFTKALRRRVAAGELHFTSATDCELVIGMYARGFVTMFESYREYDPDGFFAAYAAMDWGEQEARLVAAALAYAAKHCKPTGRGAGVAVRLEGNQFGAAGQQAIEKAVKGARSCFTGVTF